MLPTTPPSRVSPNPAPPPICSCLRLPSRGLAKLSRHLRLEWSERKQLNELDGRPESMERNDSVRETVGRGRGWDGMWGQKEWSEIVSSD